MTIESKWGLWLLWALACTFAFGVGGGLSAALSPFRDLILTGYLALAVSLVLAGALQWLLLRRQLDEAGAWALASITAVALIGVVVFGVGMMNRDAGWVLGVVVGWIMLGVFQWLVLRQEVAGAGWWIVATTLGLLSAIPVVGFVTWATGPPVDSTVGGLLRWHAFGAAYGSVTGTALLWLLRHRLESGVPVGMTAFRV